MRNDSESFWMTCVMVTLAVLMGCVLLGQGQSAIAMAILIHAELKCLEHDEQHDE